MGSTLWMREVQLLLRIHRSGRLRFVQMWMSALLEITSAPPTPPAPTTKAATSVNVGLATKLMGTSAKVSQSSSQSNQSVGQLISQSVSQSFSQSVGQSVSQSVRQPLSQSVRQSLSQSVSLSVIQSISQSINQSVCQSVDQSVSQSVSQFLNWLILNAAVCITSPAFVYPREVFINEICVSQRYSCSPNFPRVQMRRYYAETRYIFLNFLYSVLFY